MELRRGLIRDELELKAFVLFILKHFYEPISRETLNEIALERIANYFEFADALEDLIGAGLVSKSGEDPRYQITVQGRFTLQAVEASLPFSTRQHTEKDIAAVVARTRRDSSIKTSIREEQGTYRAVMELSADHGVIFSMELQASDRKNAEKILSNFRKRAERIYLSVIDSLTEEEKGASEP